ncbi:kelch repeat-containing protein [Paenibacillus sp. FSL H7-0943]|uniref:Kelch repeat-containing protein n=1 Tax=unclassified Paenibacillus TaxID=185978 RepID=UPI0030CE7248
MLKKTTLLLSSIILILSLFSAFSVSAEETVKWETKASLPINLMGSASAELNGKIYIFGGANGSGEAATGTRTNKTYMYTPETNKWSERKSMPTARAATTAAVIDDKIYVIGGYYSGGRTNVVEMYDPIADSWETKSPLQTPRSWSSSAVVNGKIYVFGGSKDSSGLSLFTVEEYDPSTNQWTFKNNMPINPNGPFIATVNDKIYITGGTNVAAGASIFFKNLYEYDPVLDTYTEKKSMPTQRSGGAAVVINGEIYYLGYGLSVEKYSPQTDTWSVFTNLTSWRFQNSAAVINNTIFIIGGSNQTAAISTVEAITIPIPEVTPTPTPTPEPTPGPEQPTGDRAILVITMNTGLEKEFDLSMDEVNAFINWYENKQTGAGTASYAINKHDNNKGPFTSRKDYVIYDKILTFEVSEYTI